jgi:hypothetical protein
MATVVSTIAVDPDRLAARLPRTPLSSDPAVGCVLDAPSTLEHLMRRLLASSIMARTTLDIDASPPLRWPSKRMGKPRIDLEDKQALWDLLDRESLEKTAP